MWETTKDVLAVIGAAASVLALVLALLHSYRSWLLKRRLTWDDALRAGETLLERIEASGFRPDLVVGLGRSGGLWGGWLAGNLGSLPFAVVDDRYSSGPDGVKVEFPGGKGVLLAMKKQYGEKLCVLVVEGATSRGQTLQAFREELASHFRTWEVKFAVLYRNPASSAQVDFAAVVGPEPWPERFPWHGRASYQPYLRDLLKPTRAA